MESSPDSARPVSYTSACLRYAQIKSSSSTTGPRLVAVVSAGSLAALGPLYLSRGRHHYGGAAPCRALYMLYGNPGGKDFGKFTAPVAGGLVELFNGLSGRLVLG